MPLRPKHVPERTCVACRSLHPEQAKQPKRDLVRVVRSPQGGVSVDPTGKKAGRGAYVCANPTCWELALAKGALDRALHVSLSAEDRAALQAYAATLAGAEPAH
jgi:predicted RNA-binding protein YlxR (DUF448 family)